jgi:hypothetical protein
MRIERVVRTKNGRKTIKLADHSDTLVDLFPRDGRDQNFVILCGGQGGHPISVVLADHDLRKIVTLITENGNPLLKAAIGIPTELIGESHA